MSDMKNYNYKRKDNKEEVQEEDERNVILMPIKIRKIWRRRKKRKLFYEK